VKDVSWAVANADSSGDRVLTSRAERAPNTISTGKRSPSTPNSSVDVSS